MKNNYDGKVKGHGYFRKTKAFGLASGIVLGAALIFGAGSVSADEVNTPQRQLQLLPQVKMIMLTSKIAKKLIKLSIIKHLVTHQMQMTL